MAVASDGAARAREAWPADLADARRAIAELQGELDDADRGVLALALELEDARERYGGIFEAACDGIYQAGLDGRITTANRALIRLLGYDSFAHLAGDVGDVGRQVYIERTRWRKTLARIRRARAPARIEARMRRADGSLIWTRQTVQPLFDPSGAPVGYQAMVTDITADKAAADNLRLLAQVFEHSADGIFITDAAMRTLKVNPAYTRITGYAFDEVAGQPPPALRSQATALRRHLAEHGVWQGEIEDRRKDGSAYAQWLTVCAVRDARNQVVNAIGIFSDISAKKAAETSMRRLAFTDALTGLPNRALFRDRLERALAGAARDGAPVAILFVDLDDFKRVNDCFGHEMGDALLQRIACRLLACVRRADTVARHGGDEFTVLLQGYGSQRNIEASIERISAELSRPIALGDGAQVYVTASIGVCRFPDDGGDCDSLLNNADAAMYRAKERGKNKFAYFDPELNRRGRERLRLQRELRRALDAGAFVLHFQPQVDCASGRVAAIEALLRWRRPGGALLRPAQFIAAAEDGGLIEPLGEWVIGEACRQARAWQDRGRAPVPVAVNISARQLLRQDVPALVGRALSRTGLAPGLLELELTENAVMRDPERARRALEALKALGVRAALDDFGTGSFSLGHLRALAVDLLKIDKTFVDELRGGEADGAIVAAAIAMGRELKLEVVAEGVERARQARFLSARGCHRLQGYLFARPRPAAMVEPLLAAGARFDVGGGQQAPLAAPA